MTTIVSKKSPTISICALAGNDHWHIDSFITSLVDFADEIVFVVSPSCSEVTLNCIKKHIVDNKVPIQLHTHYDGPYMHYGKARNVCLKNATKDYVIILDTDERLSSEFKLKIRDYLKKEKPQVVKIMRVDDLICHLVEPIERIIKNDKTIWYEAGTGGEVHEYLVHTDNPKVFSEPVWHAQKENHWLYSPQRIFVTLSVEIYRTPKTKTFIGHVLRGVWLFQYKFKKVYFKQNTKKDGRVGLKYAFMRALQAFLIQLFVGLKTGGNYKYWEDPKYEENLKIARLEAKKIFTD